MVQRIALIDDDKNILTSVSMVLESEGYDVSCYHDGEDALNGLQDHSPDLAVVDIKMPRMDGLTFVQNLRSREDGLSDIPVIFLTSKGEETDEEIGLRLGADDYISKPFSQRLLLARIHALLRRRRKTANAHLHGNTQQASTQDNPNILRHGDLVMDMDSYRCTWKGQDIDLTVTEFLLLQALAERPGHVKSRDQLIDIAYGESVFIDDRTIDSHIKRLRRKFRDTDPNFDHIETLYGAGYKFKS